MKPFATTPGYARRAARHRAAGDWPAASLPSLFAATCAARGESEALIDGDMRLRFADWARSSAALAAWLHARGVGPGSVVAYQLPNWWEAAVVFLAAARLGAIVNPLLPIFRARELSFILRQSRAAVLFLPARFRDVDYPALVAPLRPELPHLREVVTVRGSAAGTLAWDDLRVGAEAAIGDSLAQPAVEDLLLLMYTSGTTAEPKGVLHTHATLISKVNGLARVHGLGVSDAALMPSPLTHISGVLHGILTPAILGTRAVLMERWDADAGLSLIEREGVTYMAGAPTFLQDLLAAAEGAAAPRTLRLFSCGGAPTSAALMRAARERFGCIAKRAYGSTEFPTLTTTDAADAPAMGAASEGRAIPPAEVRIVGEDGRVLAAGEEGEVQARGPECFVGYTDPALNADAFTADGWFRSGDLGRLDADGYLTITGRLKEIVIRKGEKISARELEDLLATHPDVRQVCVVPVADAARGEIACAVLATRGAARLNLDDVAQFLLRRGLATRKLPEKLLLLPELPLTESGKVHRAAVRALAQQSGGGGAP